MTLGLQLFVVHAPEDTWFVDGYLLDALNLPPGQVLTSGTLDLGATIVGEIERGAVSPVTVVVVSPAFLATPWARFANDLAVHQSVEASHDGSATLVPAILTDCELPLLSRFRVPLDFRNPDRQHWESEVARLRTRLRARAHTVARVSCPYPGLRAFTTAEAAFFNGRTCEIEELLRRLREGERQLHVVGASGSGKSSLVAAGLVPSLHKAPTRAGGRFLVRQLRPGQKPMIALTGALEAPEVPPGDWDMHWLRNAIEHLLARNPGHDRLLIFVDQLEELFTTADQPERTAFIAAVRALRDDARVAQIFTLRADSWGALNDSAFGAGEDHRSSRFEVRALRGDGLRAAIAVPARGIHLEPVLLERLLHDAGDEPGAMPMLQDTLQDLWHRRTRSLLRLAEYEAMGDCARNGLAVTMVRRADRALNDLPLERREVARRILLRLMQFSDGVATGRRQQTRGALATAYDTADEIDEVIRHLADRRLVTISGADAVGESVRVDLAHEVLLSAWPTLREWAGVFGEDEQRRRRLEAAAVAWRASGSPARLLNADELREIATWSSKERAKELGVSGDANCLLQASMTALDAHVADRERRGLEQRRELATRYALQAHRRLMSDQPARAVPYLIPALTAGSGIAEVSLRMLFAWAARGLPLLQLFHGDPIVAIAWSPDGKRLATASCDQTAQLWDSDTGKTATPPLEHLGAVSAIEWSPDGMWIATASEDQTARVWDTLGGLPVGPPLAHPGPVKALAWSPDGKRLATASDDRCMRIWDASDGRETVPPCFHRDGVRAVAWSPSGKLVATASYDHTAIVWNADGGAPVMRLVHRGGVMAVAWSPDGTRLATASADRTARVWDTVTGRAIPTSLVHRGIVTAVAWSPDGTRLATASTDYTARVWDATAGQELTRFAHQREVKAAAWSPDGTRLATASADHTARVWDATSGIALTPPFAHQSWVRAVAWSPDGSRVATAGYDYNARIWNARDPHDGTPPLVHDGWVRSLAWSPDSARIATASYDGTVRIWSARSGAPTAQPLLRRRRVKAVAWSPNGRLLATASEDHTARIWDALSGHELAQLRGHADSVNVVVWSPDGVRVATASDDGTARVWEVERGVELTQPLRHLRKLRCVAWSPDGKRLATASEDRTARIWDAVCGEPLTRPLLHREELKAVAWSPDGKRIATASSDHNARIWDAATGRPITPLLAHELAVSHVAWSPDGRWLATASQDRTARIWDATTGQAAAALVHQSLVYMVAWSPDGTRVATAGDDRTARVWDALGGLEVTPPLAHGGVVRVVTWSPDGTRIATASDDRTARVWQVPWDARRLSAWLSALRLCDYALDRSNGTLIARKPRRGGLTGAGQQTKNLTADSVASAERATR